MNQSVFAQALLDPDAPVPDGVTGPDGLPSPRRFSVYRNNVTASLTRALEAAFPVVRQLVGAEFFGAMAVVYLRGHPPQSRQMMFYGAGLPDFLEGFPPVAHLPYLADVARLEQAMRESYHAADRVALTPETLAELEEDVFLASRIELAPALRLVSSEWPIHGIWAAHAKAGPPPRPGPQEVVVLRPLFDPEPHVLPPGGAMFLTRLRAGAPLGTALAQTSEDFDLAAVLGLLLQGQAITGISR